MSKQLLIETRMNALSLCEGVKSTHPGCLGTISGPCADFVNPTRNDNFYSRKLWENVFKDPLIVESLEDRVLIGELDHPGDRLETKATNACIVMTDYSFNDQNGTVDGVFDILDTPNGRILRSLLDYGCKIGVSSRGEGDVTTKEGVNSVDEESYYFVGFDAVVLPAVKKAKPTLQESLKRENLRESLKTQVESASTKSELDLIKKVVEATELPEVDSLIESIDNKSKELEGVNDSSNLLEDLERSSIRIQQMEEENKSLRESVKTLKQEVATCKSRVKRFVESRIQLMKENESQEEKLNSLTESCNDLTAKYAMSTKEISSLRSQLRESRGTISGLREELRTTCSSNSVYESKISSLEESLERSQDSNREKSEVVRQLKEELKEVTQSYEAKLEESDARARRTEVKARQSLAESHKAQSEVIKDYARRRATECGIGSKRILESITSKSSFEDVDQVINEEVDRIDRYKKIPVTRDKLLCSLDPSAMTVRVPGQVSEADSQTTTFMEQFYQKH